MLYSNKNDEHWKILDLTPGASPSEIRKAYKKLAAKYHPDRNKGNEEEAKEKFQKIEQAYNALSGESDYTCEYFVDVMCGNASKRMLNFFEYVSSAASTTINKMYSCFKDTASNTSNDDIEQGRHLNTHRRSFKS